MAYETINPATGERLQTFPEHTEEEVQEKLVHANSAYTGWRSMSFQERAAIVEKAAGIMRERKTNFPISLRLKWAN
jgi:succinate-semialdehyde dehydrogenase/glutarate-semialdehyde dehydrogenase